MRYVKQIAKSIATVLYVETLVFEGDQIKSRRTWFPWRQALLRKFFLQSMTAQIRLWHRINGPLDVAYPCEEVLIVSLEVTMPQVNDDWISRNLSVAVALYCFDAEVYHGHGSCNEQREYAVNGSLFKIRKTWRRESVV